MRELPAGLSSSLADGTTTLCRCWRVTRKDNAVFGFTDHDKDVTFDGVTYEASSGMTASSIDQNLGLNTDTTDIVGALNSEALNEEDLAKGLFDDADLVIFAADWTNPANRAILFSGTLGEVSRGRTAFTAEMRGLSDALNQNKGRIYQRSCDADLGDTRCTIDLGSSTYTGDGVVTGALNKRSLAASGLDGYANGWFTRGKLMWTSGNNAGAIMEVKVHTNSGTRVAFELWESMPMDILTGDEFTVSAGCDKSFETCKAKFANGDNFRGFPHIPSNDVLASYPNTGDDNSGTSRNAIGG